VDGSFCVGDSSWTQIRRLTRNDMPSTVQVGMVANGYTGPDVRATFDYIRMSVPSSEADCLPN